MNELRIAESGLRKGVMLLLLLGVMVFPAHLPADGTADPAEGRAEGPYGWNRTVLWSSPGGAGVNQLVAADVDPTSPGKEVVAVIGDGQVIVVRQGGGGVWLPTTIFRATATQVEVVAGEFDPYHDGEEIAASGNDFIVHLIEWVGGEWVTRDIFRDIEGVTALAIGDIVLDRPGNELLAGGISWNISVLYPESPMGEWKRVILGRPGPVYQILQADVDPAHEGNELIISTSEKNLSMLRREAGGWKEVIPYDSEEWGLLTMAQGEFDPSSPGREIAVSGWTGNIVLLYPGDTLRWRVVEIYNDTFPVMRVAAGDLDPASPGDEIALIGWSGYVTLLRGAGDDARNWSAVRLYKEEARMFGLSVADLDPLHPGPELLAGGLAGKAVEIRHEPPGFYMTTPLESYGISPGISNRTIPVLLNPLGGFEGTVELDAVGQADHIRAVARPASLRPPGVFYLTLSADPTTPPGSATLTLTARGGGLLANLTINLTVAGNVPFLLAASPESESVVAGYSTEFLVRAANGTGAGPALNATLGVSNLFGDASSRLSATRIRPSEPAASWSLLTVETTRSGVMGLTRIVVTAEAGGWRDAAIIVLNIQPPTTTDFIASAPQRWRAVSAGTQADFPLSLFPVNLFRSTPVFETGPLPHGIAVKTPAALAPPLSGRITIEASDAEAGTYLLDFALNSDVGRHGVPLLLTVLPPVAPGFAVKTSSGVGARVAAGGSFETALYITPTPLFDLFGLDINVTGLPQGVSSGIRTARTGAGLAGALRIGADAAAAPGDYTASIRVEERATGRYLRTALDFSVELPYAASARLALAAGSVTIGAGGSASVAVNWTTTGTAAGAPHTRASVLGFSCLPVPKVSVAGRDTDAAVVIAAPPAPAPPCTGAVLVEGEFGGKPSAAVLLVTVTNRTVAAVSSATLPPFIDAGVARVSGRIELLRPAAGLTVAVGLYDNGRVVSVTNITVNGTAADFGVPWSAAPGRHNLSLTVMPGEGYSTLNSTTDAYTVFGIPLRDRVSVTVRENPMKPLVSVLGAIPPWLLPALIVAGSAAAAYGAAMRTWPGRRRKRRSLRE